MRFRNYTNKYNKKNRIYSQDDIRNMTLQTLFDNENDVLAQNREIGIPTLTELQNSQNTQWVDPFVNNEGKNDGGYWQSIVENKAPEMQTIESFIPKNNNNIMYAQNQEQPYFLQGGIEYNQTKPNLYIEKLASKYEGLSPKAALQKAAAKIPIWKSSEKEYYEHALKLADGEEPTEFMKENNDFRKIDEITDPELKQIYIEKAAKMYGLDINDPTTYDAIKNTDVVMPKENSQLHSQIKNSETFQRWVAENYENIENQTNENESSAFPAAILNNDKRALYATVHNTDLKNSKINEDGSFSTVVSDAYDFENWKKRHYKDSKDIYDPLKIFAHNRIVPTNNRAKEQQDAGQLQRYLLSTQINLSKEEVDEILRKYRRK